MILKLPPKKKWYYSFLQAYLLQQDLNQAMEVLGLSYMNLFQEDNLKQLFMEIQGTLDITDVLMDDDLSIMLTQVFVLHFFFLFYRRYFRTTLFYKNRLFIRIFLLRN